MRILIIGQYFWPESFRINDIAMGLVQRGHKVTVLTGMPNYPKGKIYPNYGMFRPSREEYGGIEIIRVPIIPRGKSKGIRLTFNYLSFIVTATILGLTRCRDKYDVSLTYATSPITQCLPALVLKWSRKIPHVLYVQDLWPESLTATGAVSNKPVLRWVEKLVRFIYKRCNLILVQSKDFVARVEALGGKPGSIHYLPNSAEALYQPVTVAADVLERTQLPGGFNIMFAGNLGAAQDLPTVVAAAEKLRGYPEIHFTILGDGRRSNWLQKQVEAKNLTATVHLLGRYPVEKMPIYFALADLMLVTLRDEPIFALTVPSKVQSYLACGRPIVAAIKGAGAEVLQESKAGIAVVASDSEALAAAILQFYNMAPLEREKMGHNGRKYFLANFEREMLLTRLENMLKGL